MKNKMLTKIMTSSVVAIATTVIYTTTAFGAVGTVREIEGDLNVRALPDVNSEVVSTITKGETVEVIAENNGFYTINYNNTQSYVAKEFLRITESEGTITGNSVRVREVPKTGNVIATVSKGEVITVIGFIDGWWQVKINDQVGFISGNYINVQYYDNLPTILLNTQASTYMEPEITTYGLITGAGVNLRSDMTTDSNVLTVLGEGAVVDIETEDEDWVKVSYANKTGYVSADYLDVNVGEKPAQPAETVGNEIIDFAKGYIGTRYVWGGTSLTNGVDCSGFTQSVFKNFGININRVASAQYQNGYSVSKSELQAGDLVFFDTNGRNNGEITHVGIYMGDGNFIHSSSSKGGIGITITPLNKTYYVNGYVGARRVIQ